MELYGVEHGAHQSFLGLNFGELDVIPSKDMLARIEQLPHQAVVGIEATQRIQSEEPDEDGFYFSDSSREYWQQIIGVCLKSGLEIAYLDSDELYKKMGFLSLAANDIHRAMETDDTPSNTEKRDRNERAFALDATADYVFAIERELAIFEKMRSLDLGAAIIGSAHADYLVHLNGHAGIDIDNYWRVPLDTESLPRTIDLFNMGGPVHQRLEQGSLDRSTLRERTYIERNYHAAASGRVIPDKEPAWIGSWQTSCRPAGLFEIFPSDSSEDGQYIGVIEDALGTATFSGEFTEDIVEFEKRYSLILNDSAALDPITYSAHRTDENLYSGEWQTAGIAGEFTLARGSVLYEPAIIDPQLKLFDN